MKLPRVLVVDDSAFARSVLTKLLLASGKVEVVGRAHDGFSALEQITALDPDVITLDLTMPDLDGIGVLRALAGRPRPRVIVVSISGVDTALGVEALTLGAVDIVTKPTALASDRLYQIGQELVAKIVATTSPKYPRGVSTRGPLDAKARLVVVGTSTGGPQALTRLTAALPADFAAPVVIALHIPAGYTTALAARLDKASKLKVVEAHEGLIIEPGMVVIAPGGAQTRIIDVAGRLVAELSSAPKRPFAPSVDELFLSAAEAMGAPTLGVVLTGMGDDGLEGAQAIVAAGGSLVTEAAESCIVYGMPRTIDEANLGATSVPLDGMAAELARRV